MSNRIPPIRPGVLALLLGMPAFLCWSQETTAPATAETPAPPAVSAPAPKPATVGVVLHTERGDIHVALEVERAPVTARQHPVRHLADEAVHEAELALLR